MSCSRAVLVAFTTLAAACDLVFLEPDEPASNTGFQLALLAGAADGVSQIVDRLDRMSIELERPAGLRRDTVVMLEHVGGGVRARVRLEPEELIEQLQVRADLFGGDVAFFTGQTRVDASGGTPAAVTLPLSPVVGGVRASPSPLTFDAIGDSMWLSSAVLFTTGDTVPGLAATWSSSDPSIVEVSPDGHALSRGNGLTWLTAAYGGFSEDVTSRVSQVPAEITGILPDDATLTVGESLWFQTVGTDRLGSPLGPGATVDWRATGTEIVSISHAGLVLARTPGAATVTALAGSVSFSSSVMVAAGPPPVAWGGVAVSDLAGESAVQLHQSGAFAAWAPDRAEIAFVDAEQIWLVDLSGNAKVLETGTLTSPGWPEYSADGSWIFFDAVESGGQNRSVYRIRPDGSDLEVLTPRILSGAMPTSSPDGTQFAYVTPSDLVVQTINGPGHIAVRDGRPLTPAWSPDGEWIAFVREGRGEVMLVRPDGSNLTRIEGHGMWPGITWSPDSEWLLGFEGRATLVAVATGEMMDLAWGGGRSGVAWWR